MGGVRGKAAASQNSCALPLSYVPREEMANRGSEKNENGALWCD